MYLRTSIADVAFFSVSNPSPSPSVSPSPTQ